MGKKVPLHSLGQDNQNEIQHDLSGHLMLLELASVSHAVNSTINGTIAFLKLRQLKWGVGWLFSLVSCDASALVSASCDVDKFSTALLHSLGQDYQNEEQDYFFGQADTIGTNTVIMSTELSMAFHRSRQSKWLFGHLMSWVLSLCHMTPSALSVALLHFLV